LSIFYQKDHTSHILCKKEINILYEKIPELPFSNIYLAQILSKVLPKDSVLHLGVSNTMRSWTFFDFPQCNLVWANTGCRGIDGALPTAIGMSFASPSKIHYCILGDLTFFYGMNVLGNRDLGKNLRILLINNGRGTEFRISQHKAQQLFDNDADPYIAAAGHFGNKSRTLVRDMANNLGFKYLVAENKKDIDNIMPIFSNPEISNNPILLEVFIDSKDETAALDIIRNLVNNKNEQKNESNKTVIKLAEKIIKKIIK